MSRTKAFSKAVQPGNELPYDGGFTVFIDENGNVVCGIPQWATPMPHPKDPVYKTDPVFPDKGSIGPGDFIVSNWPPSITTKLPPPIVSEWPVSINTKVPPPIDSNMPTPIKPLPDNVFIDSNMPTPIAPIPETPGGFIQPAPQSPGGFIDPNIPDGKHAQPQAPAVPGPVVPGDESADVYDPWAEGEIVCFIPPGAHIPDPSDTGAENAIIVAPPDYIYEHIKHPDPTTKQPEGPWSGPYPVPEGPWTGPQPVPEDRWSGPYPAAPEMPAPPELPYQPEWPVGTYPPIHTLPVEPAMPLTIDFEGTISHNPIDFGDTDIQAAINDFVHSSTGKEAPVKQATLDSNASSVLTASVGPADHAPVTSEVAI